MKRSRTRKLLAISALTLVAVFFLTALAIVVDGQGVNTLATARNASRILAGKGQTSALVVSQFYHLPRAKLAFRRAGFARVASARARFFEWRDIYATAREVVAFYDYLLFARASA